MYFEEKKSVRNDGQVCNILCHVEKVEQNGLVFPAHFHSYIEMLYGIRGEYEVLLNGEKHRFTKGDLALINSREVHQIDACSKDGGEYIVVRFEPEILYSSMFDNYQQLQYVMPFLLENAGHQKVMKEQEIGQTFIPELMYEILKEYEEKEYGYELAIKNHIGRIFLWILRYFHKQGLSYTIASQSRDTMITKLKPCLDYVEEHYVEELKAQEMAVRCNMSYSYFSRIFNQNLGRSFHEYLNYIRVREAEKMLVATNQNVTEIATEVGFATTSYFIKQFKLLKNISPKQFQKEFGVKQM